MTLIEQIAAGQAPGIAPLTVEQYHKMIAQGILREGDSLELIDGMLIRKDRADRGGEPMSHGPRHRSALLAMQEALEKVKEVRCHLPLQMPVTLGENWEPEPDLAVIRGKRQNFTQRHPGPGDIMAVMEVADSSLNFDRTTKQGLYAAANIPFYWIVNLVDNQIEVYQDPQPAARRYARRTDYHPGQMVPLTLGPDLHIEVDVSEVVG